MRCTQLVIEDHSILCRALNILDAMIRKLETGERIEIADVTGVLRFLRVYGFEYHQNTEQKILFPALLRAAPQATSVSQLLLGHNEQQSLVTAADTALQSKHASEFVRCSRRLSILLRNDFQNEEIAFREVDGMLSKDDDTVITAEIEKNQKQVDRVPNLARLELKYTPRPVEKPLVAARDAVREHGASSYRY